MGWTGLYHKPKSIPAYFKSEWEKESADGTYLKCLGQAFVGRFVLYGVWERRKPGEAPYQFATVTLIQYKAGNCEWYYKDMDETVGPNETKCPKSLLKKLKTPAYNDYARAWRKACWQHALGLTKASAITKARRIWHKDRLKAIEGLEAWNKAHPEDKIHYRY